MKRKILMSISLILILIGITGCKDMMNTPSKRVEEFFNKYQTMDSDVLTDLDTVIDKSDYLEEEKQEYKDLMKKQYQNLSYKIKDEQTNGNQATVTAEIEVFDYQTAKIKADKYIEQHQDELKDEKEKEAYRLKQMKATTEKINYTIEFHLVKDNKTWVLEEITDTDLQKIHGLYTTVD